jgi:hypothetical protein
MLLLFNELILIALMLLILLLLPLPVDLMLMDRSRVIWGRGPGVDPLTDGVAENNNEQNLGHSLPPKTHSTPETFVL